MDTEVLLVQPKTLHPECFLSDLIQCKDYYHIVLHTSRMFTGSGIMNEEATKMLHIILSPKVL